MASEHAAAHEDVEERAAPGGLEVVRAFLNTRDFDHASEALGTPDALRDWLAEHDLLDPGAVVDEADRLRAIDVREALRALCLANNGAPLEPGAVDRLNRQDAAGPVLLRFAEDGTARIEPAGSGVPAALAKLLATVFRAMEEGTWCRMKACPADDCRWVFYDHSRNRSGHWCTMAVCGNRAKARAYRRRHRGAES